MRRHGDKATTLLAALAVALVLAPAARAGTIYRWVDENGRVHFGDVPPPHVKQFQIQSLPDAAAPDAAPAEPPPAADAKPDEAKPGDATAPKGPARVVLTQHQVEAVGPAVQSFHGKVKNEGGAPARDVSIAIVVIEPTQGDECLRDEIDVDPATLAPGAEGTFEAEFDNPCFHGPTRADLQAQWR